MDINVLLGQLNDIIECGICAEAFSDPRFLPCVHTFCLNCLQRLVDGSTSSKRKLICPMCRAEFNVPPGGLEALQRNFFMKQLLDVMKDSNVATREDSPQNHSTGSGSKSLQSKIPLDLCRKHKFQELCMYCQDCQVVLCSRCFEESHRRHRTSNLKEIGEDLRKRIQEYIEGLSVCQKEVRHRRDELEKTKLDFLTELDKSEEAVNAQFVRVSELIDQQKRSLICELATMKSNRLKEIETDKDDLERHLVVLESCERYMQDLRIKTSVNDICRSIDELNAKVQELRTLQKASMESPNSLNPMLSFEASELDGPLMTKNKNILGQIKVRHPGQLKLDTRLNLDNLSARGVAGQHGKYYVISWNSDVIEVYREQSETYLHLRRIKVPGLNSAQDIAICRRSGCLYVTDQGNACVWRVKLDDHSVKRWLSNIDDPYTVSVTEEGEVVLAKNGPPPALTVYNPDARLLSSTPLPVSKERVWHVVRRSSLGNYIVSQGHFVYEMTPQGKELRRTAHDPSAQFIHLAMSEDYRIFAADYVNGRVVLLDTDLSLAEELLNKTKNGLQWPCRLSYSKRRLLVVHEGIDVYTLLKM